MAPHTAFHLLFFQKFCLADLAMSCYVAWSNGLYREVGRFSPPIPATIMMLRISSRDAIAKPIFSIDFNINERSARTLKLISELPQQVLALFDVFILLNPEGFKPINNTQDPAALV